MGWWWLVGLGCTTAPPVVSSPRPVFNPAGLQFFDTPWPSDRRRDADGTLVLDSFPDPADAQLLDAYVARGEAQRGFGTNSPVYVQLDGPLDPLNMPLPDEAVSEEGASVYLVDVDPDSAHWGERFPIIWEQNAYVGSAYQPEHLLAVAPMHGYPLRPDTKYALILTTQVVARHEGWAERLEPTHPEHDADLLRSLFFLDLHPNDVAIATTFTTLDPLAELTALADFVQRSLPPAALDVEPIEHLEDFRTYTAWRGRYPSPVFTTGEPPYQTQGGAFAFNEAGEPQVVRWDDMRLAVCAPRTEAPEGGWPVVIYQHGTGGDYRGFCDSDRALEVMNRLGAVGLLGLGIDQTLHGSRPGAEIAGDLSHFNLVNPDSGVTNFRQGAIDLIYLARSLAARPHTFRSPDGQSFRTDPSRVLFMGHSQGGLTGALAAPYIGNDVQAMVLSGTGAVLAITVVERKDPFDFETLVRGLVRLDAEEPFTPLHPISGLIQTLVEPTDPANYAPFWFSQRGAWRGHTPVPILLTSGTADVATPYRTAIALAAAGRVPFVGVPATDAWAVRLRTGPANPLPQYDNAVDFAGTELTAGFHQWWDEGHGVVFQEREASDVVVEFLRTAADGAPTVKHASTTPP